MFTLSFSQSRMLGDSLGCHNWGCRCYRHLVSGDQGRCETSYSAHNKELAGNANSVGIGDPALERVCIVLIYVFPRK